MQVHGLEYVLYKARYTEGPEGMSVIHLTLHSDLSLWGCICSQISYNQLTQRIITVHRVANCQFGSSSRPELWLDSSLMASTCHMDWCTKRKHELGKKRVYISLCKTTMRQKETRGTCLHFPNLLLYLLGP